MAGLFISIFVIFGNLGLWYFRFHLHRRMHIDADSNEAVNYFGQMIGLIYGILTGLIIVTAWQNFDSVNDYVENEASAILIFERSVGYIKSPQAERIHTMTLSYLRNIIEVEWPTYANGGEPLRFDPLIRTIRDALYSIKPVDEEQKSIVEKAFVAFERVIVARQSRIETYINTGIPSVFWIILTAGALITLTLTFFVHFKSYSAQVCLTTLFAISIGLVFFLMAAIDNPYRGQVHVSHEPYEALYKNLVSHLY